jgi:hypothetical protein
MPPFVGWCSQMADEVQKQKWIEARRRYVIKHREKVLQTDREAKRKKYAEDHNWREEINFKRRANGIGITKKQWNKMFDDQGRVCAICKTDNAGNPKGWQLDHCHKTKVIRFILCTHCNRGLGGFKDNPVLLRLAADMLEEFNAKQPTG